MLDQLGSGIGRGVDPQSVGVGDELGLRFREVDRSEDFGHALRGLGHERRMGGHRHRQQDAALGPQLLGAGYRGFDCGPVARDHDLSGRVPVGNGDASVGRTECHEVRQPSIVQADDGGHATLPPLARGLHLMTALAHQPHRLGERQDAGRDHGAVLAHRMARVELGLWVHPSGAPAFAKGGEKGDRDRDERRLGVGGEVQLLGRALEGEPADRLAQGFVRLGHDCRRRRRRLDEGLAHPHCLGTLARKHESDLQVAPRIGSGWPRARPIGGPCLRDVLAVRRLRQNRAMPGIRG